MSTIDSRVVEMSFDNSKFGTGVEKTLSLLDRLKAALHLDGASKGLSDINAAAGNFNSSPMEQGVGRISASFTSLQAVAFGALANIGAKVSEVALSLARGLTIGPIAEGLDDYHAKLTSVQTIMNATGASMDVVDGYFSQLDTYADTTIYNLTDMTGAFAKFTNAGVGMDQSVPAIQGIANMTALAGQNSEAASIAMYNLSQSIAGGFLTTTDYKSLNLANVATKEWKDQMIQAALAAGTLQQTGVDAYHIVGTKAGSEASSASLFNDQLAEGWASSQVLLDVLGDYGDTTTDIGKKAQAAAQDVKSFPMMMETLKASVGTGWTDTFEILLGNVDESKELFTGLTNSIGGFLGRIGDSRNALLGEWKEMGGRTVLIDGLKEAFWALAAPIAQVGAAFRTVFPKSTGADLYAMTVAFRDFMLEIQPSRETLDRLKRTFAGLFAILGIGWEVIKAVGQFLAEMFLGLTEGDSGVLKFTATIGDFLVGLHAAVKAGDGLNVFFDKLRELLFKVINPIKDFGQVIGNVFAGLDFGNAGAGLGAWISDLLSFGQAAESAGEGAEKGKGLIQRFVDFFRNIASTVGDWIAPIVEGISGMFDNIDYDRVLEVIQTGLLGGLVLVIKQLGGVFSNISIFGGDDGPSFIDRIKEGMDSLTGTLSAMQANLKASMLIKIAGAIALLAAAVFILAQVDTEGLIRATAALTVMFIQLGAAMFVFQSIGTVASIAKLNLMGAALILIAGAILILTFAVTRLSDLSWDELARGLAGLTAIIAVIIALAFGLDKAKAKMVSASVAMVIMGGALHILISAVQRFAEMDIADMVQGITGVVALLGAVALFTRLAKTGPGAVLQATSILLLSGALLVLFYVVKNFASISWSEMAKGFTGLALGMIAIGLAMRFMPSPVKMTLAAFSIGKVALAFGLIASVFKDFESISWGAIQRGLVAIIGAFATITIALRTMPKVSVPQILVLLALSFAIRDITQSLKLLGDMDAGSLGKSMAVFAGVMATIVGGLRLMKGTTDSAAAIAIVAGSFQLLQDVMVTWGAMDIVSLAKGMGALIGVLLIMVVALNLLKTEAAGAAALALVAGALSLLVPVLTTLGAMPIIAIGAALVALAGMFAILVLGLRLLQPVIPVLISLSIAIGIMGVAVALAGAGLFLFAAGLTLLATAGAAGTAAIVGIVSALVGLIPLVMEQIGLGLIAFANVISTAGPAILAAITTVLMAFLQAIIDVTPKIVETLLVLLDAFLDVIDAALPRIIQSGINLIMALLDGVQRNIGGIVDKVTQIVTNFLDALARNLPAIIQSGINLIVSFVQGLADGIRNNSQRMVDAGLDLVDAIIDGIVDGVSSLASRAINAVKDLASDMLDGAMDMLGIGGPSRRFEEIGEWSGTGMMLGIQSMQKPVAKSAEQLGESAIDGMTKSLSGLSAMLDAEADMTPVIAPVLDLSGVRRDAAAIDSIISPQPFNVGTSLDNANNAYAGYRSNQEARDESDDTPGSDTLTFIQNNYSPKAISAADTYRNTKSQLSVAKEALK